VIGLPHPSGRAAMRMLENEGFAFENYIDIFDGGPTMTARTDQVKTVREARSAKIVAVEAGGTASLIAAGRMAEFRAALGDISERPDGVAIDPVCAEVLGVGPGDEVIHAGR